MCRLRRLDATTLPKYFRVFLNEGATHIESQDTLVVRPRIVRGVDGAKVTRTFLPWAWLTGRNVGAATVQVLKLCSSKALPMIVL